MHEKVVILLIKYMHRNYLTLTCVIETVCFVDSMRTFFLYCHERASILPVWKASTVPRSFKVLDLKDCGNPFQFEFNVPIKQNIICLLSEAYTTTDHKCTCDCYSYFFPFHLQLGGCMIYITTARSTQRSYPL